MGHGCSTGNDVTPLKYMELGQGCMEHARQAVADQEIRNAIEAYENAISYFKDAFKEEVVAAKGLLIQCYLSLAELYEQQKSFDQAKYCYTEGVNLGDPVANRKLRELIARAAALQQQIEPPSPIPLPEYSNVDNPSLSTITDNPIPLPDPNTGNPVELLDGEMQLKEIFTNNSSPIATLSEYKSLVSIETTQQLAGFLIRTPSDSSVYTNLHSLALKVINAFAGEHVKSQDLIKEVTALAASENDEIIRNLLQHFIQPINDRVLLDADLLNGLAEIIQFANPGLLNADDLSRILKVMSNQLNNLHQPGSMSKLLVLTQAISRVLAAMADANVKGLSRTEQHEPLYKSLTDFIETRDLDFHCRQAALYARQALVRVPDDESKLQAALRRIIHVGRGLNNLHTAIQQKSPAELLNAFTNFKEAFRFQTRQKLWYDELRYMELLIQSNHFTGFEKFVKRSEHRRQEGMLYGTVRLLKQTIETHVDISIRCNALKFLTQLWQQEGEFEAKIIDRARDVINEYTLFQDGEFAGKHKHIQRWIAEILLEAARNNNQQLRQTAKNQLDILFQTSTQEQHEILNTTVPTNYHTVEVRPQMEIIISVRLLEIAKRTWETGLSKGVARITEQLAEITLDGAEKRIKTKLTALKNNVLENQDLHGELATYIPVNGSYQRYASDDGSAFDLISEIQNLLSGDIKKVILLLGSAGGGKSTFNRYLEKNLWEQYQEGEVIPLFISLPSLANPETRVIEEHLQSVNPSFSDAEILILKEKYKFIFILDGYDEINKFTNLYLSNNLKNWNAKTVISCRTDYLTKIANNDTKRFMPCVNDKPDYQAFIEMSVVPFSDEKITAYITKYLTIHNNNPDKNLPWKNANEYETQINNIFGLKQLIRTPFLLMVTMEVLPQIVRQYAELKDSDRINLTRTHLLNEFVQQLFEREEDKLMVKGKLPTDGTDVKEDFWAFAIELAVAMKKAAANDVYYVPKGSNIFGNVRGDIPWEERFFGTPGGSQQAERLIIARNGCNCVLRTIGKNRRAFIHTTLQDYFFVRKIKLEEEATPIRTGPPATQVEPTQSFSASRPRP